MKLKVKNSDVLHEYFKISEMIIMEIKQGCVVL